MILSLCLSGGAQSARAEPAFALQGGDRVAFLGDSNTDWGTYPAIIQAYARKSGREISIVNAGLAGDVASAGYYRMKDEIFRKKANVIFVAFGINDTDWGNDRSAETRKLYLDYIRKIVADGRKHGARVYVLSYPMVERPLTAPTNPTEKSVADTLAEMSATDHSFFQAVEDDAMAEARRAGGFAIDVQRSMRKVLAAHPGLRLHKDDGVHLNRAGNEVVAAAILQGLGASDARYPLSPELLPYPSRGCDDREAFMRIYDDYRRMDRWELGDWPVMTRAQFGRLVDWKLGRIDAASDPLLAHQWDEIVSSARAQSESAEMASWVGARLSELEACGKPAASASECLH